MIIDRFKTVVLAAVLGICSPVVAQDYEVVIGEDCVYTRTVVDEQEKGIISVEGTPCFEILTRSSEEIAKVFLNIRQFREETLKVMGVKWFKATLLSTPSDEHEQFTVTTYYESKNAFQFAAGELTYFKSKNGAMIASLIGIDLIGMRASDLVDIFGEGVRTSTGNGYRYMHNLIDAQYGQTEEKIYFYIEDDVVVEMAYERDRNEHIASGLKSFWGYTPVSEGWCTKGECSYNNVKIRESIPDGEVVGRINVDDGADMAEVMVLKTHTIGQRYNWVKIITKSGLTGWVYGKFVRPGVIGTSYEQCLNNSIEYCKWFAANPNNVANSVEDFVGRDGRIIRTKYFNTSRVEYFVDDNGNEIFLSMEINDVGNKFSDSFCGLRIGSNIEAANNFCDDMKKADAVPQSSNQRFSNNSSLSWVTVDQKHRIAVETSDGVVSKITIRVFEI